MVGDNMDSGAVQGLDDINYFIEKLPHDLARADEEGKKLGFFYAKFSEGSRAYVSDVLKIILEQDFMRKAFTRDDNFIGLCSDNSADRYKEMGDKIMAYCANNNIKIGTASAVSTEKEYEKLKSTLDDLAEVSLREDEHKHLE